MTYLFSTFTDIRANCQAPQKAIDQVLESMIFTPPVCAPAQSPPSPPSRLSLPSHPMIQQGRH
eukprot:1434045-Ditylum_brightwellii.AAC.1